MFLQLKEFLLFSDQGSSLAKWKLVDRTWQAMQRAQRGTSCAWADAHKLFLCNYGYYMPPKCSGHHCALSVPVCADNTGVLLFSLKYLIVTKTPCGGRSPRLSVGWRRFSRKISADKIWGRKSPDFKQWVWKPWSKDILKDGQASRSGNNPHSRHELRQF